MQKIIKISLVVMLVVALVMGIFQLAPDILINVGWNTGASMAPSQGLQVAHCNTCGVLPPYDTLSVGWNTGT